MNTNAARPRIHFADARTCLVRIQIPERIILAMHYLYPHLEETATSPEPPSSKAKEAIKFWTPLVALLISLVGLMLSHPGLSRPVWGIIGVLSAIGLVWFGGRAFSRYRQRVKEREEVERFLTATDTKLKELMHQFAEFISTSNTKALLYIVRSAYSQNATTIEQIITGDYIGAWFHSYQEELSFPTKDFHHFLARCRTFGNIVQQFNTYYVQHIQKQLSTRPPLNEQALADLETFREEYNAFLRATKIWATGIWNYLQARGVTSHPSLWQLAPTIYYEPAKPFVKNQTITVNGT